MPYIKKKCTMAPESGRENQRNRTREGPGAPLRGGARKDGRRSIQPWLQINSFFPFLFLLFHSCKEGNQQHKENKKTDTQDPIHCRISLKLKKTVHSKNKKISDKKRTRAVGIVQRKPLFSRGWRATVAHVALQCPLSGVPWKQRTDRGAIRRID